MRRLRANTIRNEAAIAPAEATGIGFIVGVNLADKNVREIVFRSAPAEIGFVISISMIAG